MFETYCAGGCIGWDLKTCTSDRDCDPHSRVAAHCKTLPDTPFSMKFCVP
jgi:hypothetical protein